MWSQKDTCYEKIKVAKGRDKENLDPKKSGTTGTSTGTMSLSAQFETFVTLPTRFHVVMESAKERANEMRDIIADASTSH